MARPEVLPMLEVALDPLLKKSTKFELIWKTLQFANKFNLAVNLVWLFSHFLATNVFSVWKRNLSLITFVIS